MPMRKERRAQWVEAGYCARMGSAEVAVPPPNEWVRAYHFTSAEYAISDIAFKRIKVARFSDLNDPFELLALSYRASNERTAVKEFKSEYNSHTGVVCFSANWTSPVLWSHYGAKHRGICLGLNLKRTTIQPVRYSDERIRSVLDAAHFDPSALDPELQQELLCTKFSHWSYEQEIRRLVPLAEAVEEGSLHFLRFNSKDLVLAEVILGPQCRLPLSDVRRMVDSQCGSVITFQSRLAFKSFDVVPKESTVP